LVDSRSRTQIYFFFSHLCFFFFFFSVFFPQHVRATESVIDSGARGRHEVANDSGGATGDDRDVDRDDKLPEPPGDSASGSAIAEEPVAVDDEWSTKDRKGRTRRPQHHQRQPSQSNNNDDDTDPDDDNENNSNNSNNNSNNTTDNNATDGDSASQNQLKPEPVAATTTPTTTTTPTPSTPTTKSTPTPSTFLPTKESRPQPQPQPQSQPRPHPQQSGTTSSAAVKAAPLPSTPDTKRDVGHSASSANVATAAVREPTVNKPADERRRAAAATSVAASPVASAPQTPAAASSADAGERRRKTPQHSSSSNGGGGSAVDYSALTHVVASAEELATQRLVLHRLVDSAIDAFMHTDFAHQVRSNAMPRELQQEAWMLLTHRITKMAMKLPSDESKAAAGRRARAEE
jgi:hypothetical protein